MAAREPSAIRIDGEVAYVTLTKGFEAVIDAADVPLVEGKHWRCAVHRFGHAYANTSIRGVDVGMHRLLLSTPKGTYCDHVDGDGLNNRRSNIRNCTQAQNIANKVVERRNKLGLKGVSLERGKYRAKITPDGRTIHLGTYKTPEEAEAAYRGAAKVLWGDFAQK